MFAFIDIIYNYKDFIAMFRLFFIILLLLPHTNAYNYNNSDCQCLNGGKCSKSYFQTPCECPPLQIGKYCQTQAKSIQNNSQKNIGYVDLGFGFQHFVFLPKVGNYFRFNFNVCTISNIEDLECLIFMTSDQQDGSPSYQPPIISAAKIKPKEGTCSSFSSPYIQIKKNIPLPYRRIIIGVRSLQKDLKSYFYRTVTGRYISQIPQDVLDNQPLTFINAKHRLYVNVTYQHYKQTMMESVVHQLIQAIIMIAVILAIFLFSRIVFFSYGIDIKDIFLWVYRSLRTFCKKLCPLNGQIRNYRNYLKVKALKEDEEQSRLTGKDQCAICLQQFSMEDLIEQTACKHIYHQTCLEEWELKNEICPLCRQKIRKIEGRWLL